MGDPTWWNGTGEEPDPRMSLANERTLLAYVRTSLGLVVAGLAVTGSHVAADLPLWFAVAGLPLIAIGTSVSLIGRRRFIEVQRAVREGSPLPAPTAGAMVPYGIAAIGAFVLIVGIIQLATA